MRGLKPLMLVENLRIRRRNELTDHREQKQIELSYERALNFRLDVQKWLWCFVGNSRATFCCEGVDLLHFAE